jgi:LDH2 family malate/lactate/ureidoglycolate dehydrogenase
MSSIRYSCEQLTKLCRDAFHKFGFTKEEAIAIAGTVDIIE